METVYHLPELFIGGRNPGAFVHHYLATQASARNRVCFSDHLICLILNGQKEVYCGGELSTIESSQILLLPAATVLMSEKLDNERPFESLLLFLSPEFIRQFCREHKVLLSPPARQEALVLPKDDYLQLFEKQVLQLLAAGHHDLLALKAQELLVYLCRRHPDVAAFLTAGLPLPDDEQIKTIVAGNAAFQLSIEEMAFLCHMSVSTFKRHFRAIYGQAPGRYFTQLKMLQACFKLACGQRPSQFYLELGYENLASFSKEFRKYTGMAPRQYQERMNQKDKLLAALP